LSTFVLIYGAHQGDWIWHFVAKVLEQSGDEVLYPTLDGCVERPHQVQLGIITKTQAGEFGQLLFYEDLNRRYLCCDQQRGNGYG